MSHYIEFIYNFCFVFLFFFFLFFPFFSLSDGDSYVIIDTLFENFDTQTGKNTIIVEDFHFRFHGEEGV